MKKANSRKIIIPAHVIKMLPALARRIASKFRKRKLKYEIETVGTIWLTNKRQLEIYVSDDFGQKSKKYKVLASYYRNDCICVFRTAVQRRTTASRMNLILQRILAHEIAHAIDRKRIVKLGRNNPKAGGADRTRIKYVCHPVEYDAEIASIAQVAVPYMLQQRTGPSVLIDFFTNSKRLWPLSKYKPFWPIMFNGYLADWSHSDEVSRQFFHDLAVSFCESSRLMRRTKRLEVCACPIIRACLRKMKCSPILGAGRSSVRGSRGRRSCVPRNGSETGVSGARSTASTFSLPLGKRSAKAA